MNVALRRFRGTKALARALLEPDSSEGRAWSAVVFALERHQAPPADSLSVIHDILKSMGSSLRARELQEQLLAGAATATAQPSGHAA